MPTFKPTPVVLTGCVDSTLRVRSGPGTDNEIIGRLLPQHVEAQVEDENYKFTFPACVQVVGRNEDTSWIMVSQDGATGWVFTQYIHIQGDVNQLSIVGEGDLPLAQQNKSIWDTLKENKMTDILLAVVDDPQYDENASVLHKYNNSISVEVIQDTLIFAVIGDEVIANEDDFISLSYDLILLGAIASEPGTADDWGIQRIEVISPGPFESFAKLYVDGADNILAIAENQIKVFDVMENDISYGTWQTPTVKPSTVTDTPRPGYIFCKDTWNRVGSFVTCKIPRAYCSYQPSTSGSPTFCNDAPYPSNSFTLVAWESNWSDLDGSCILVSGTVTLYNGKPQIEANSRSQVSVCP